MLRKNIIILFVFCVSASSGVKFRFFDKYEYNLLAAGWLKLHKVPLIWSDARLMCHAEGSVLASPLTSNLRDAIQLFAQQNFVKTIFTGVHSTFSKGVYAPVEGVPLDRMPITWAPGEPDNHVNSEDCLAMMISKNGSMADVKCTDVLPYVCYKKFGPLVVSQCGTTDTEYDLDERTGSCYKFHRRGLTWSKAYMTCMAEGGHLAMVNSDEEANLLAELYSNHPNNVILSKNPDIAFIGFLDWKDGGSWMTIHGETLTEAGFNRWWDNELDNAPRASNFSSELCGSIVRSGVFYHFACNETLPFICKKKPESLANNMTD